MEDIEIITIIDPYIYSVKYEGNEQDEFNRLFDQWNDVEFVLDFMERNCKYLKTGTWKNISEPEDAASQVFDEAEKLEVLFDELAENTKKGLSNDFDSHFKFLDGKYKLAIDYVPVKSYGTSRPSLLRIYAIKICANTYLITGGGIKLSDKIQNSPDLRNHVLKNIDIVRSFLRRNGIEQIDDLRNIKP